MCRRSNESGEGNSEHADVKHKEQNAAAEKLEMEKAERWDNKILQLSLSLTFLNIKAWPEALRILIRPIFSSAAFS